MLQQTQVSTVIPYYHRFIEAFPTVTALASADDQDILRLWQGLGYYYRARHLLRTAKIVAAQHGGIIPSSVEQLLDLPGIGRYTAGAIASIAFDRRAPILDGNVVRVICRLDGIEQDPRLRRIREQLWQRAEQILPRRRVGDFNSALMDLGATVCTSRTPRCVACPLQRCCKAHEIGAQDRIPRPAPAKTRPTEKRWTFCIRRKDRFLIEQRPNSGRWAGMWQFVSLPAGCAASASQVLHQSHGIRVGEITHLGTVEHGLTHRQYQFEVYLCSLVAHTRSSTRQQASRWVTLDGLSAFPLPRPQLKIAYMLQAIVKK